MNSPLTLSATELARLIKSKKLTSQEVVEAHIVQIQKVNPMINAVVKDRFDQARAEAKAADKLTKEKPSKDLPVFHGVPCTIKENFALQGMPHSSGLVARKNIISETDAPVVQRLKQAGAIPLGSTNTSELCMWMETSNRVYGRTNNPYDPKRIVGGSSGGEGAIIGAGGSPFGVGSDVGGSVRMPAFFNGVFGHKPTGGLIPNTGQYPIMENEGLRYLATGPLARRAEDLMPLLKIMAGPDGLDSGCCEWELKDPSKVNLSKIQVIDVHDNGFLKVSSDLKKAQANVVKHFSESGAHVKTTSIKGLKKSFEIWSSMLSASGGRPYSVMLGNGEPINAGRELMKWSLRCSHHTLPSIALAGLENITKWFPKHSQKHIRLGHQLREEIVHLIGKNGVMIFPSYTTPAPIHYRPILTAIHWVYTAIFNVLELPVTQVPLGLNKNGLPLGVQVVATHGNDHLCVAVAMELEKAFGGWVMPNG